MAIITWKSPVNFIQPAICQQTFVTKVEEPLKWMGFLVLASHPLWWRQKTGATIHCVVVLRGTLFSIAFYCKSQVQCTLLTRDAQDALRWIAANLNNYRVILDPISIGGTWASATMSIGLGISNLSDCRDEISESSDNIELSIHLFKPWKV